MDLSTCTLAAKARTLDQADGVKTTVSCAPRSLWLTADASQMRRSHPREVVKTAHAGMFSYVQHAAIEAIVFAPSLRADHSLRGRSTLHAPRWTRWPTAAS